MTDAQNREIVALYEQWSKTMVHLTVRRLRNLELAKDLVQEVFLLACCKADEMFEKGDNPKAWLFRVLELMTIQERKRCRYGREVAMEHVAEMPAPDSGDLLGLSALFPESLSEEERSILLWRLEDRLTYEEIARRSNATPEACRKRYSRAVKHCRILLEKNL